MNLKFITALMACLCISNHAESGLTARSFMSQRRLDKVLDIMKPGDYVLVEFGHNDLVRMRLQKRPQACGELKRRTPCVVSH